MSLGGLILAMRVFGVPNCRHLESRAVRTKRERWKGRKEYGRSLDWRIDSGEVVRNLWEREWFKYRRGIRLKLRTWGMII